MLIIFYTGTGYAKGREENLCILSRLPDDTVWHSRLWFKFWEFGVRGKMWRVIKRTYESSKSAVLLDGE